MNIVDNSVTGWTGLRLSNCLSPPPQQRRYTEARPSGAAGSLATFFSGIARPSRPTRTEKRCSTISRPAPTGLPRWCRKPRRDSQSTGTTATYTPT